MTIPAKYDFTAYKGASLVKTFTYQDSAGTAINLTGYSATFSYRDNEGGASATKSMTIDALNGKMTVSFSPAETAALTQKTYSYSISTTLAGITDVILIGTLNISDEAVL